VYPSFSISTPYTESKCNKDFSAIDTNSNYYSEHNRVPVKRSTSRGRINDRAQKAKAAKLQPNDTVLNEKNSGIIEPALTTSEDSKNQFGSANGQINKTSDIIVGSTVCVKTPPQTQTVLPTMISLVLLIWPFALPN
jgi:hypothetical protein